MACGWASPIASSDQLPLYLHRWESWRTAGVSKASNSHKVVSLVSSGHLKDTQGGYFRRESRTVLVGWAEWYGHQTKYSKVLGSDIYCLDSCARGDAPDHVSWPNRQEQERKTTGHSVPRVWFGPVEFSSWTCPGEALSKEVLQP